MTDRASTDAAQWRNLTPEQRDAISRHLAAGKPSPTPMIAPIATSSRKPKEDRVGRNILIIGGGVLGAMLLYGLLNVKPAAPTRAPAPGSAPVASTTHASVPPASPKPAQQAEATASSSDPDVRSDGGLDYVRMKAEAEEQLKSKLTDDDGLRYRNVHTKLSTLEGGGIVAFCGEVNSRSPLGGYGGFRRFLASRSVAATEDTMPEDDFAQAWSRFCTDGVEGPKVWF